MATDYAMRDFWTIYWDIRNRKEWPHRSFDSKKAYLCCMLSELAYEHLKQHEIDQWNRMKLFPCNTLETAVASGPYELGADIFLALPGEGPEVVIHVVETPFFISVIIVIEAVVFIAVRGTADAYDRRVDFDYTLVPPFFGKDNLGMHRGFLGEALKHADLIANRLALNEDDEDKLPTIYICGHSLGGAVAAILHALYSIPAPYKSHYRHRYYYREWTPLVHLSDFFYVDSCYSFGMPRYGDVAAMQQLANPYSVIRPLDPIIYVPFQKQGYADSLREYGTDLSAGIHREHGLSRSLGQSLKNIFTHRSWSGLHAEHKCELYREEIARTLSIPFHPVLLPPELLDKRIT